MDEPELDPEESELEPEEPVLRPGTVISVIMARFSSKWMEAAKEIAADPVSPRRCPQCIDATLEVADAPLARDRALVERIIRCEACDVEVSIELRPQPA